MRDWLVGSAPKYLSFIVARSLVRSMKLGGVKEYRAWSKAGRPSNIPAGPDSHYKDKGWVSFPDWLGNTKRGSDWGEKEGDAEALREMKGLPAAEQGRRAAKLVQEEGVVKRAERLQKRQKKQDGVDSGGNGGGDGGGDTGGTGDRDGDGGGGDGDGDGDGDDGDGDDGDGDDGGEGFNFSDSGDDPMGPTDKPPSSRSLIALARLLNVGTLKIHRLLERGENPENLEELKQRVDRYKKVREGRDASAAKGLSRSLARGAKKRGKKRRAMGGEGEEEGGREREGEGQGDKEGGKEIENGGRWVLCAVRVRVRAYCVCVCVCVCVCGCD